MRKIHVLGIALVVFAFGAMTSSAMALESVWLKNNELIAVATPANIDGELSINVEEEPSPGTFGKLLFSVTCSGSFIGTVGPDKADEITSVENLSGVKFGALGGTGLNCTVGAGAEFLTCDNSEKLAELWPDNLPWKSELFLEGAIYKDHIFGGGVGKEPGFDFTCKNSIGGTTEGLCEGLLIATNLTNVAEGAEGVFTEAENISEKCTEAFSLKLAALISGKGIVLGVSVSEA